MRKRRLDNPNTSKDFHPFIVSFRLWIACISGIQLFQPLLNVRPWAAVAVVVVGARHGSSLYMMYGLEMWHDHHPFTVSSAQFTGPCSRRRRHRPQLTRRINFIGAEDPTAAERTFFPEMAKYWPSVQTTTTLNARRWTMRKGRMRRKAKSSSLPNHHHLPWWRVGDSSVVKLKIGHWLYLLLIIIIPLFDKDNDNNNNSRISNRLWLSCRRVSWFAMCKQEVFIPI